MREIRHLTLLDVLIRRSNPERIEDLKEHLFTNWMLMSEIIVVLM